MFLNTHQMPFHLETIAVSSHHFGRMSTQEGVVLCITEKLKILLFEREYRKKLERTSFVKDSFQQNGLW